MGFSWRLDSLPLLATVSFAHYGDTGSTGADWLATAYLDLFTMFSGLGPYAELAGGLSLGNQDVRHTLLLGGALIKSPPIAVDDPLMIPALHAFGQLGHVRLQASWYPGRLRRAVASMKSRLLADANVLAPVLDAGAIIAVLPDSSRWWHGWEVKLRAGSSLQIRFRDPYVDCFTCGMTDRWLGRYLASPGNRIWWIWQTSASERPEGLTGWSPDFGVWRFELDMEAARAEFERDGVLRIQQAPDLLQQTLARHDRWWRDLSLGVGYVWSPERWSRSWPLPSRRVIL